MVLTIAVTVHLQTGAKSNTLSYLFFSQKAVTALLRPPWDGFPQWAFKLSLPSPTPAGLGPDAACLR